MLPPEPQKNEVPGFYVKIIGPIYRNDEKERNTTVT